MDSSFLELWKWVRRCRYQVCRSIPNIEKPITEPNGDDN